MKFNVYALHDRLLGAFLVPFYARAHIEAMRQIHGMLNDDRAIGTPVRDKPDDYDLYHLGTFEDTDGKLVGILPAPDRIAACSELRNTSIPSS